MTEEEIKKKIEKLVEHADVHKKDESINAEELEWIQVFSIGMIKEKGSLRDRKDNPQLIFSIAMATNACKH
jgi:hypothetical protein